MVHCSASPFRRHSCFAVFISLIFLHSLKSLRLVQSQKATFQQWRTLESNRLLRNESGFMLQTQDVQQLVLCQCYTNKRQWMVRDQSSQPLQNWTSCQHIAFMGNLNWTTQLRKFWCATEDLGICSRFGMGSIGVWWKGFGITHGDEHCAFCRKISYLRHQ